MADIGFQVRRLPAESWRDAVARLAKIGGMERECLSDFDTLTRDGTPEHDAAFCALYEWDCCPMYVEHGRPDKEEG